MASNPFIGRWRIVHTTTWGSREIHETAPAHVTFNKDRFGELHLLSVDGTVDHRIGDRDGKPGIEFSWEGCDEMDPVCGRGWAVLAGDEIEGEIFIHGADGTWFQARREERPRKARRRGSR